MSTFLVDHALANVWCTPEQDRQYIFRPAKLSMPTGSIRYITVANTLIALPTTTDYYYVYQIGAMGTDIINIMSDINTWTPVPRVMRDCDLVIDLYDNLGIQYPRFASYLLVTASGAIIVAIRKLTKLTVNLGAEDLFIRFYSNAYFGSVRNGTDNRLDNIYSYGLIVASSNDILDMQTTMAVYTAMPGHVYGFINGYFVNTISVQNTIIGDVIELVYDSTIKEILNFSVSTLDSFDSILDLKRKYLLHNASFVTDSIEFQDDIDCYLYKDQVGGNVKGLMFHKNQPDAFRNVTHKDYSMTIPYVQGYVDRDLLWDTLNDVKIRLFVRDSGWDRPLVNEASRIKELYKLSETDIRRAMLGIDAVVPQWHAAALEANDYCRIMRNYAQFITQSMVESAYGYNAISKIVANTPQTVVNDAGELSVELPYLLQNYSTIYEFNSNGLLLGSHAHIAGIDHVCYNSNTAFIQAVTGMGGLDSGSIFNVNAYPIQIGTEYRFYKAIKSSNITTQEWIDVTGTTAYAIVNGLVQWSISLLVWDVQIRNDRHFIDYNVTLPSSEMLYRFSINANATVASTIESRPIRVPYGELDIWLNGYYLAYGIDYFVNWPEITIINKQYATNDGSAVIHVRARGFCGSDLAYVDNSETGWVTAGLLSYNHRFNIRDDRVMQVAAAGRTLLPSSLQYGEIGTPTALSPLNNRPYVIRDIRVGLGGVIVGSTDILRSTARAVDSVISDYLTIKTEEIDPVTQSIGITKYQIYSPFLASIIYDLLDNSLPSMMFDPTITDTQLRSYCTAYLPLLDIDPCIGTTFNDEYVIIAPFPKNSTITMPYNKRYMLVRLIKIYLNNRIDLTPYVTVSGA